MNRLTGFQRLLRKLGGYLHEYEEAQKTGGLHDVKRIPDHLPQYWYESWELGFVRSEQGGIGLLYYSSPFLLSPDVEEVNVFIPGEVSAGNPWMEIARDDPPTDWYVLYAIAPFQAGTNLSSWDVALGAAGAVDAAVDLSPYLRGWNNRWCSIGLSLAEETDLTGVTVLVDIRGKHL